MNAEEATPGTRVVVNDEDVDVHGTIVEQPPDLTWVQWDTNAPGLACVFQLADLRPEDGTS